MRVDDTFVRLNAADERALARAIREAEREVLEAVRGDAAADRVLGSRSRRAERTRAAEVDRLRDAVDAMAKAEVVDGDRLSRARKAWERSHRLRWRLAMSARHVVPPIARQISSPRVDPEDLVNEGIIGLHRAAKRFDPEQGVRFPTYARWWARAQMTRFVDGGGRPIRLPGGAVEARRHLLRLVAEREAANVDWTAAELAEDCGLSEARVRELLAPPEVGSLDAPIGDEDGGRAVVDVLPDSTTASPDDQASDLELTARLRACLGRLSDERLHAVIAWRFGLDGREPRTLKEIGAELGLSRERVRQLEIRALAWLREQLEAAPAA